MIRLSGPVVQGDGRQQSALVTQRSLIARHAQRPVAQVICPQQSTSRAHAAVLSPQHRGVAMETRGRHVSPVPQQAPGGQ